ncbi:hypothetical protein KI688_002214 [Linnemannia hyalina]|uniref:HCP-like protein n=1 Tax=Linnemannia hyalina TaxID=64524 RepID=A0A9P7XSM8_9FUNG|nr:hypothetical protein KI688_002214 [Linnemannia hyalina]
MDDELEGHFQALRSVYKRSNATVASPELPESEIVHIDIYQDPTGKDIILWEEILGAFKGADNVRHKTRSSQYGSEDVAFYTSKDFDLPTTEPTPQTTPNDVIGGSQLHSHSSITHPSVDTNNHSSVVANTLESASPDADRIADLIAKTDRGDMDAQVELGDAYETGKGLTMDHTSAMKYFRKAANRGHAMAQCRMGLLYLHGRGVGQNHAKATEWFRMAAGQDLPQAQCQLGLMESDRWNYSSAMTYFLKAAKHGHAESEVHIAMLFMTGQGVLKDYGEAIEWLRKAMEDDPGYDVAPFEMGMMYYQGRGVPLDFPKAEELFVKAGNLGNVDARRSLGVMYRNGQQGVARDFVRAMEWLHKAADQNDMVSQFTLGVMYDNGEGVVRDSSKAMEWYLRAADRPHVEAYFCIGVLYYDGWGGLPRDLAKAKEWFNKAADIGHYEAKDYLRSCVVVNA